MNKRYVNWSWSGDTDLPVLLNGNRKDFAHVWTPFIYFLKDESTNTTWSAFIKSAEMNPSGQCKEEAGLEG